MPGRGDPARRYRRKLHGRLSRIFPHRGDLPQLGYAKADKRLVLIPDHLAELLSQVGVGRGFNAVDRVERSLNVVSNCGVFAYHDRVTFGFFGHCMYELNGGHVTK